MRLEIEADLDYTIDGAADVLLQIEVASMADQKLMRQELRALATEPLIAQPGEEGVGQRTWARGHGQFQVEYRAVVEVDRPALDLAQIPASPPRHVPALVVPYLLPSRYCPSEQLEDFVRSEFAGLEGGALATALAAWVRTNLTYASNTSSGVTTALDTFHSRRGVCRDYAHLLTALARAGDIPARCVSAYAPGVDPPDFHAVTELWLGDSWHLVDATGMSAPGEIARVAVGRDATDIAFMTIFGTATLNSQSVRVQKR